MIRRLDHLNIVVSDLATAADFFVRLGFQATIAADLDTAFLQQVTGITGAKGRFIGLRHPASDLAIELLQFANSPPAATNLGRANVIGLRHLALEVDDIDVVVAQLTAQGITFLGPVQTWNQTGKRLVYFQGPDGILMELAQYPHPTPRISAGDT